MIRLLIKEVVDSVLQENMRRLVAYFDKQAVLKGNWKFVELVADSLTGVYPRTDQYRHGLGFQPKDLILTSQKGAGVVTFNYDKFTVDSVEYTVTGPATVRFFIGRYEETN